MRIAGYLPYSVPDLHDTRLKREAILPTNQMSSKAQYGSRTGFVVLLRLFTRLEYYALSDTAAPLPQGALKA